MNISRHDLAGLDAAGRAALLARVQQADTSDIGETVETVVAAVRAEGDAALVRFTAEFDGVQLDPAKLAVTEAEFDAAEAQVPADVKAAIELAVKNIRHHHAAQVPSADWMQETSPGVISGERYTPIASTGLYVPRGKGSFPSVMTMLSVPAVLAKVPVIAVCTPPGPGGEVDAASLYAARLSGIDTIYRVGGAQAIAALAYGTESLPKVEKIVGPGNRYVTHAKRLVYGQVNPGPPAGPSESIVLADDSADPSVVAHELLVEAEHGPDSAAVLVTTSHALADAVSALLPALTAALPEPRKTFVETVLSGFGGIVVAPTLDDAIAFCNEWAPEHLHAIVEDSLGVLHRLEHAGEILLGEHASIAFGNYVIGLNAILPTGGFARGYSCVGVDDFIKRSSFAYVTAAGARALGPSAATLADYEGFPAHAAAARHALARAAEGTA
ncbi:histidinol dehydrogenase [Paraconexibacter antarcticus]|uniref:Histidinol dehydrogenase n=1 Tax=Paraconexibacter antarcticus TaxID=2949664 RepID=A0ABY5DZ82_9ACTN|nr:histidinol dehydrogenase [Paraconexibacter antarcticus]UTI65910.1 histidinol dehydrogenase [Paraconexibacter antarcticus]